MYAKADFDANIFMFAEFMCHGTPHFKGLRFQACKVIELAEDGEDRMDDHAGHTAFVLHPHRVTSTCAVSKKRAPNSQKVNNAVDQLDTTFAKLVRSGVSASKLLDV